MIKLSVLFPNIGVCWKHYEYNGGLLLPHKERGDRDHFKESELALIL